MKRIKILTLAGLILLGFNSCKKKIYGCMDENAENYSPVATQDGKDCVYKEAPQEEVLVSSIFNNVVFTQNGNELSTSLTWYEITQDVINNGAVSVYMKQQGDWGQLPVTIPQQNGSYTWTTSIIPSYNVGYVDITIKDSDGALPLNPGAFDVKIVILK